MYESKIYADYKKCNRSKKMKSKNSCKSYRHISKQSPCSSCSYMEYYRKMFPLYDYL